MVKRNMRPPTTKGTLVTLHDGTVVQAVFAQRNVNGVAICRGCVGHNKDHGVRVPHECDQIKGQCGAEGHNLNDAQFIFIPNTPQAMAEYVLALLGEQQ